ncbi:MULTISPECIES: hypothetical protein [unclassified Sporosarcina]|uniref:hypothetical protein n=1 Tax=unclassified Sporosarcina TaxID=2647733 RepID=UPI00117B7803
MLHRLCKCLDQQSYISSLFTLLISGLDKPKIICALLSLCHSSTGCFFFSNCSFSGNASCHFFSLSS